MDDERIWVPRVRSVLREDEYGMTIETTNGKEITIEADALNLICAAEQFARMYGMDEEEAVVRALSEMPVVDGTTADEGPFTDRRRKRAESEMYVLFAAIFRMMPVGLEIVDITQRIFGDQTMTIVQEMTNRFFGQGKLIKEFMELNTDVLANEKYIRGEAEMNDGRLTKAEAFKMLTKYGLFERNARPPEFRTRYMLSTQCDANGHRTYCMVAPSDQADFFPTDFKQTYKFGYESDRSFMNRFDKEYESYMTSHIHSIPLPDDSHAEFNFLDDGYCWGPGNSVYGVKVTTDKKYRLIRMQPTMKPPKYDSVRNYTCAKNSVLDSLTELMKAANSVSYSKSGELTVNPKHSLSFSDDEDAVAEKFEKPQYRVVLGTLMKMIAGKNVEWKGFDDLRVETNWFQSSIDYGGDFGSWAIAHRRRLLLTGLMGAYAYGNSEVLAQGELPRGTSMVVNAVRSIVSGEAGIAISVMSAFTGGFVSEQRLIQLAGTVLSNDTMTSLEPGKHILLGFGYGMIPNPMQRAQFLAPTLVNYIKTEMDWVKFGIGLQAAETARNTIPNPIDAFYQFRQPKKMDVTELSQTMNRLTQEMKPFPNYDMTSLSSLQQEKYEPHAMVVKTNGEHIMLIKCKEFPPVVDVFHNQTSRTEWFRIYDDMALNFRRLDQIVKEAMKHNSIELIPTVKELFTPTQLFTSTFNTYGDVWSGSEEEINEKIQGFELSASQEARKNQIMQRYSDDAAHTLTELFHDERAFFLRSSTETERFLLNNTVYNQNETMHRTRVEEMQKKLEDKKVLSGKTAALETWLESKLFVDMCDFRKRVLSHIATERAVLAETDFINRNRINRIVRDVAGFPELRIGIFPTGGVRSMVMDYPARKRKDLVTLAIVKSQYDDGSGGPAEIVMTSKGRAYTELLLLSMHERIMGVYESLAGWRMDPVFLATSFRMFSTSYAGWKSITDKKNRVKVGVFAVSTAFDLGNVYRAMCGSNDYARAVFSSAATFLNTITVTESVGELGIRLDTTSVYANANNALYMLAFAMDIVIRSVLNIDSTPVLESITLFKDTVNVAWLVKMCGATAATVYSIAKDDRANWLTRLKMKLNVFMEKDAVEIIRVAVEDLEKNADVKGHLKYILDHVNDSKRLHTSQVLKELTPTMTDEVNKQITKLLKSYTKRRVAATTEETRRAIDAEIAATMIYVDGIRKRYGIPVIAVAPPPPTTSSSSSTPSDFEDKIASIKARVNSIKKRIDTASKSKAEKTIKGAIEAMVDVIERLNQLNDDMANRRHALKDDALLQFIDNTKSIQTYIDETTARLGEKHSELKSKLSK